MSSGGEHLRGAAWLVPQGAMEMLGNKCLKILPQTLRAAVHPQAAVSCRTEHSHLSSWDKGPAGGLWELLGRAGLQREQLHCSQEGRVLLWVAAPPPPQSSARPQPVLAEEQPCTDPDPALGSVWSCHGWC